VSVLFLGNLAASDAYLTTARRAVYEQSPEAVLDRRPIVWIAVKDEKPSIGSKMIVRNVGAFRIAAAIIAAAHKTDVRMLARLICFFI